MLGILFCILILVDKKKHNFFKTNSCVCLITGNIASENAAQVIPVYEISSDSEDEQPTAMPDKKFVLEDIVARLMTANDLLHQDNQNLRVHVEALQSRVLQQINTTWDEPSASSTLKTGRNNGHDQQENREPK